VEYIGFVISLLALIYLFFRQQFYVRDRQEQVDEFRNEELMEDDPLHEIMKAVEKEKAARKATQHLPPSPPKVMKQSKKSGLSSLEDDRFASQIEKRQLKSSLENRHLKPVTVQRLEEMPPALIVKPLHHVISEWQEIEPSRAEVALKRLSSRRDLIIYQEIIDKPKSLRPYS
jgi:hypothetical protein